MDGRTYFVMYHEDCGENAVCVTIDHVGGAEGLILGEYG